MIFSSRSMSFIGLLIAGLLLACSVSGKTPDSCPSSVVCSCSTWRADCTGLPDLRLLPATLQELLVRCAAGTPASKLSGLQHFNQLQVLQVERCAVTDLAALPTTLQRLLLRGNQLQRLAAGILQPAAHSLTHIDLSDNPLQLLEPSALAGLANLSYLSLAGTQLTTLRYSDLIGLGKLIELDLSGARLSSLDEYALRGALRVERVDLSNNLLTRFNFKAIRVGLRFGLSTKPSYSLLLHGNPWHCNCESNDLTQLPHSVIDPATNLSLQVQCQSPVDKAGLPVSSFSSLTCEPPQVKCVYQVNATIGHSASITCSVTGEPEPNITWTTPTGLQLTGSSHKRFMVWSNGTLVINPVELSDLGKFNLLAENFYLGQLYQNQLPGIQMYVAVPTILSPASSSSTTRPITTTTSHMFTPVPPYPDKGRSFNVTLPGGTMITGQVSPPRVSEEKPWTSQQEIIIGLGVAGSVTAIALVTGIGLAIKAKLKKRVGTESEEDNSRQPSRVSNARDMVIEEI